MRIRWLKRALQNLDEEASFIAATDPGAARQVVGRVMQTLELLSTQPGMGRAGRVPGTRECLVPDTHYLIPYRVRGQTIEVLRLFHTARRLPRSW